MSELIERQAVIDLWDKYHSTIAVDAMRYNAELRQLPLAQPDNQVHLCDSCSYTYPECPSVYTDMIFGNGTGNDNICACSKYLPSKQPEIIRCKDCKHLFNKDDEGGKCWHFNGFSKVVSYDDFCSRAERRADELGDS